MQRPFIQEICEYLSNILGGRFAFGIGENSTLMIGELVRGKNGTFAVASPGGVPDKDIPIRTIGVDFWVQNSDSNVAFDDALAIFDLFHQLHHYTTDNYYIHFSYAASEPADLDRDAEGRKILRLSVIFIVNHIIS